MTDFKANEQKLIAIALLGGYLFFIIPATIALVEAYRIYTFLETTSGRLLNRSLQKVELLHTINQNSYSIYTASANAAVNQEKSAKHFYTQEVDSLQRSNATTIRKLDLLVLQDKERGMIDRLKQARIDFVAHRENYVNLVQRHGNASELRAAFSKLKDAFAGMRAIAQNLLNYEYGVINAIGNNSAMEVEHLRRSIAFIISGSVFISVVYGLTAFILYRHLILQYRQVNEAVKQKEAALEEVMRKEERFRTLIEHGADMISLIDKSGTILYVSPGIEKITGFTPDEIVGSEIFSLLLMEQVGETKKILFELLNKPGIPIRRVNRFKHKTGGYVWLEGVVINLLDDENVQAIVSNYRDITERKEAEEQLQKAEANYREIFDKASDGIFIIDTETGEIINANQRSSEITGYLKEDLIGRHLADIYSLQPDFTRKDAEQKIKEAVAAGQIFKWEYERKDGSCHWLEVRCNIANIAGTERIIAFFHEIDDRKEAEHSLRVSEEELRALFAAITDVVVLLDEEGRFLSIAPTNPSNPYKPSDQLIGRGIAEFLPTEDSKKILEQIKNALSSFQPLNFEFNVHLLNDKKVWFAGRISPLTNKTVFLKARDITDQKSAEFERMTITNDLIQRNKDLEQFTYIVSHNLRAPVANIIGLADTLNDRELGPEGVSQMTEALITAVTKLDNIIKDLNHILQVKRQVIEKKEMVRFSELLADIQLSNESTINKEGVSIVYDFSAVDEILTIKSYLYSVFFNLVSNSIKYRQPHLKPVIEIRSEKSENKIELVFKDNGLGIDLEKRGEQVFGLYKRFHTHAEGKGMGLYMVKTQVETLGGKISVNSEVNKGTQFRIEFENN